MRWPACASPSVGTACVRDANVFPIPLMAQIPDPLDAPVLHISHLILHDPSMNRLKKVVTDSCVKKTPNITASSLDLFGIRSCRSNAIRCERVVLQSKKLFVEFDGCSEISDGRGPMLIDHMNLPRWHMGGHEHLKNSGASIYLQLS